ncbi:hypothetical protein [Lysinibacillus xylanilyticus]|uniref:hypothetical protein n=1 Tax=Lysinibacillus xylanilyticus TaxID=582475 RepID=UPI003D034C62
MTKTTYKVGDKVRILDADKIKPNADEFETGEIATVTCSSESGIVIQRSSDGKEIGVWSEELQYIEKVEKSDVKMTQFKVGDKAKVISLESELVTAMGAQLGEIVEVTYIYAIEGRNLRCKYSKSSVHSDGFFSSEALEKISPKPTKNQRISTLEKEVETLKAEMAALKASQKPSVISGVGTLTISKECDIEKIATKLAEVIEGHKPKSADERRKAIIDEAKAFVESNLAENHPDAGEDGVWFTDEDGSYITDKAIFHVNVKKRAVTCLIVDVNDVGEVYEEGIAKCTPGDVFNEHIGKAIALGRALGLDVSKFEKAAQPSVVVVGQVVKNTEHSWWGAGTVKEIEKPCELRGYRVSEDNSYNYLKTAIILNDTEAQY